VLSDKATSTINQEKMKKQISMLINLLLGNVTTYAKSSQIKGQYSDGKRDMIGKDWQKV
jgi:hypothetical protein